VRGHDTNRRALGRIENRVDSVADGDISAEDAIEFGDLAEVYQETNGLSLTCPTALAI
jgi:hypothetical protein